jgi:hypothetical protein
MVSSLTEPKLQITSVASRTLPRNISREADPDSEAHRLVRWLPTYRFAYRCLMLDTPYKIYTLAASCGHKWKKAEVKCDEAEYIREVLCVSWMLVEESRFDWMALSRI